MAIPKARPSRPVGATLDSALSRQARAKKNLALVEVQLTAAQQKKEEARASKFLCVFGVIHTQERKEELILLRNVSKPKKSAGRIIS